ncbi:MAG: bacillithiol biosynthesis cysteine-adding enzyme BshC [Gemmatimonadaceae bacterium]
MSASSDGPRILSAPIGGGPLAKAGLHGTAPAGWFSAIPQSPRAWRERAEAIHDSGNARWLSSLQPAFAASGAALERLTKSAEGKGLVVTSGQQPGLFGGPLYTWTKALTVRALADALERAIGVPVAPVFWAATDDSDVAEGAWTTVAVPGGSQRLELTVDVAAGTPVSHVVLDGVAPLVQGLAAACGSGTDTRALDAVRRAYRDGATVGGAYVELLRALLEPLGVAVLDAAHPAVRAAAHPLYLTALERADHVHASLVDRTAEIRSAGYEPQVATMDDLSLVFEHRDGRRSRIARRSAQERALSAVPGELSPNVLLRPIAERFLLPTLAYAAGPGEFAYFAQVSAVARALDARPPLAVPRWSATLVEPQIDRLLARYQLTVSDLANAADVSRRLAEAAVPSDVISAVAHARGQLDESLASIRASLQAHDGLVPVRAVDAVERAVAWRLDRLARRLRAGARRRDATLTHDLGTMSGALYPEGVAQERALNIIPLLVRYGLSLLDRMTDEARHHAEALVDRSGSRSA